MGSVGGRADRGPGVTLCPPTGAVERHGLVRPYGSEAASDDSKNFRSGLTGKRPVWERIDLRGHSAAVDAYGSSAPVDSDAMAARSSASLTGLARNRTTSLSSARASGSTS